MDPKVINQWILKVGRDEMDADDMAEEWVKNNMSTVNKWIN
jgi:ABC-type proline/glycine betaine transport system substrate-binding protein